MSKNNEMPERIWAVRGPDSANDEIRSVPIPVKGATEYRRTPSLPDVMENGDKVYEFTDRAIHVGITTDKGDTYPHYFTRSTKYDQYRGQTDMDIIKLLGLPELRINENNQIVKVKG